MTLPSQPNADHPTEKPVDVSQPAPKPPPSAQAAETPEAADQAIVQATDGDRRLTQWVMLACIVASYLVFWYAGSFLSLPAERGIGGSLVIEPGLKPVVAILSAAVLLLAVTVGVEFVAGRFWLFAGPLAATAGLSAWSFRGGPSYYSIIGPNPATATTTVFLGLAFESLLLAVALAIVWFVLERKFATATEGEKPFTLVPTLDVVKIVLTQAASMAILVLILVTTAEKKQAVLGVLASSFIATGITRHFHDSRNPGRWCWAGPMLVAVVGYLGFWILGDPRYAVETGQITGLFAPLARPLPIDYAGAGVVGALLGLAMTTTDWEVFRSVIVRGTGRV